MTAPVLAAGVALVMLVVGPSMRAATLWSDSGSTLAYDTGPGADILDGALKRDDTSNDTLYFRFHIDPLSDSTTEEYFAALELFELGQRRVGVGNALAARAYSAFFGVDRLVAPESDTSYLDLRSSVVQGAGSGSMPNFEAPRRGVERTIVFKIQYVPGGEDLVTVWLNPDLSPGATEVLQPEALTTRFSADASFDEVRLRHGGGGEGWVFSDLAIATSFGDFVDPSSAMAPAPGASQVFDAGRFHFQTWHRDPGMPRTAIEALAQTADGYLWLAGRDQVARFDGVRFVRLDLPTDLGGAVIQTLFGDSHGALWVGTDHGLARYVDGHFEILKTGQGLPANTITALAEDEQGTIWIGTTSGLIAWHQGELREIEGMEPLEGSAITALYLDSTGIAWIGVPGRGVFRHERGELSRLTDPGMDSLLQDPRCLLVDDQGRIWVGVGKDFVLCRDDDGWQRYRIPGSSGIPHVRALGRQADGTVWAGSVSEGLFYFKEGRMAVLNSNVGLMDDRVSALFLDRQDNLWVGGAAGLHLLRRDHHVKLGKAEGLSGAPVAGLAQVAPGVMWAVQPGRGLHRWEGRAFRRLMAAGLDPADPVIGPMLVTRDGACWIACTDGLLLFRDPQAVADESLLFGLQDVTITVLAEADDGSILAGTREGQLWRLHRGQWLQHVQVEPNVTITALAVESDGLLWVGTDGGGLHRLDDPTHARFSISEGLACNAIRALHRDTGGLLWIGTDAGLTVMSNRTLVSYTTSDGLPDNHILGILEDKAGRLWLHDSSGLACIAKPSVPGGRLVVLAEYPMTVGGAENPSAAGFGDRIVPGGCLTRSGLLWFVLHDGIVVLDPPEFPAVPAAPSLILEEVMVDGATIGGFRPIRAWPHGPGDERDKPAMLRLGPGRHRVDLRYASLQLDSPEKLRFRYRMEGLDQDWVEAGTTRMARYSYLPPGDYRFAVEVYGANGRSNRTSVGLSVARHFWQEWWVMATGAIGLVAAIGGGARFAEKRRMTRRVIRLEQEHALERERTRIAQDLHDEMGAKLCRISYLSEHAGRLNPDSSELREQISDIAVDSRELLHSLDEIVWVVNPENDTLEHLASYIGQYAQNYFHGTGVECELDISSQLPDLAVSSQTRHHLFMAVHESLTNALKHSGATLVRIGISYNGLSLGIEVNDNGKGFDSPSSPGADSGNGLSNMQQRTETIGGQWRVESAPGRGTTIRFVLPLAMPEKKRVKS